MDGRRLLLPPPKKEVMYSGQSVCLFVCYSKSYERILMKFFGGVGHAHRTKWLDFGANPLIPSVIFP